MVIGQGMYDPFASAERDTYAMATAPWWVATPLQARQQRLAQQMLSLPDGSFWLFGALARWYRRHPSDGGWYLCPPPVSLSFRTAARPLPPGTQPPSLPSVIVPSGPDFAYDRGSHQAFVGPDVLRAVTEKIRVLVREAANRDRTQYPLNWPMFAPEVPSTVAAVWGTCMWCAYAPVFDGNEVLLSTFGEFLGRPLPGDEWVRWLPPIPLVTVLTLYTERLREGRIETAVDILQIMSSAAQALRVDSRFRPRADALLAMIGPPRDHPPLDYGWLAQGDQAVYRSWLARCPAHLTPATMSETSPGETFRHALYDLSQALSFTAVGNVEPRQVAAALVGADVAHVRPEVASQLVGWMEPEMRFAFHASMTQPAHPLRAYWPTGGMLPPYLRPADSDGAASILGASYATDLAWCRLTNTSVPQRGFPTPAALVRQLTQ